MWQSVHHVIPAEAGIQEIIKESQLNRATPSLNIPCNCGSNAHYVTAENSPCGLKQFGCLTLHFAKSHIVSGIFAQSYPGSTADINNLTALSS